MWLLQGFRKIMNDRVSFGWLPINESAALAYESHSFQLRLCCCGHKTQGCGSGDIYDAASENYTTKFLQLY